MVDGAVGEGGGGTGPGSVSASISAGVASVSAASAAAANASSEGTAAQAEAEAAGITSQAPSAASSGGIPGLPTTATTPFGHAVLAAFPGATTANLAVQGLAAIGAAIGMPDTAGSSSDPSAEGAGPGPGGGGGPSDQALAAAAAPVPVPVPAPISGTRAASGLDLVAKQAEVTRLAEETARREEDAAAAEKAARTRARRVTEPLRLLAANTAQTRTNTTPLGLTGVPANLRQPSLRLGG